MELLNEFELNISNHLLSALIYSDESGLNEDDKQKLEEFYAEYSNGGQYSINIVMLNDEMYTEFRRCNITRLYSDTIKCIVQIYETRGA